VGSQQYSPTFSMEASGWNVSSSLAKGVTTRFQTQATQEASGDPTATFAIHMVGGDAVPLNKVFRVDSLGNVVIGAEVAVATAATSGFLYIPSMAGTPSGTPVTRTGKVALNYDTTNNKLYIYNGGWKLSALQTASGVISRFATSTNYTLTAANHYIASTATQTNTLTAASAVSAGQVFIIKNVAGTTTVRPAGSDTIDSVAADDVLTAKASHTYISDGVSNWELN